MSWTIVVSDSRDGIAYSPTGDYKARCWDIEIFHDGRRAIYGVVAADLKLIEAASSGRARADIEANELTMGIQEMIMGCVEKGLEV